MNRHIDTEPFLSLPTGLPSDVRSWSNRCGFAECQVADLFPKHRFFTLHRNHRTSNERIGAMVLDTGLLGIFLSGTGLIQSAWQGRISKRDIEAMEARIRALIEAQQPQSVALEHLVSQMRSLGADIRNN